MKKIFIIAGVTIALALSSCSVTETVALTTAKSIKTSTASRTIILGISFGHTNVGIEEATKGSGISKISTVEFTYTNFRLASVYKTTVTGE